MTDGEDPDKQAECSHCGRGHPGTGCGGFAPPVETRFQPGQSGNPGGRLKGSPSIRAALRREVAAGFESDPDGLGIKAVSYAQKYLAAVESGDLNAIKAFDALSEQLEGKPTEYVHRTDNSTRTVVVKPAPTEPPAMP